ncbi:MAG: hypothetical protein AB7N91_03270 [Candidatus Tectimicrobiota bacterium]
MRVTVEQGERFRAKFGRTGLRRHFRLEDTWRGRYSHTKQLAIYAVEEDVE